MSALRPDVLVVGAGLVGAACAAELAAAGLEVAVLDAAHPGGGTTAAGMGHVVAMDDSPAQLALCRFSQQLWDALVPEMPRQVERERCGTLWIAADAEEMAAVAAKEAVYAAAGIPAEVLDARAVREAEPRLRPGMAGGLRLPEDSVLYPPAAVDFLLERARRAAAGHGRRFTLLPGTRVERLEAGDHGIAAVLADGSRLTAGFAISAAGLEALALLPSPLPDAGAAIKPRKGHLVITDRYPGFCRHQLVELGYLKSAHGSSADSVAFNLQPRATGQMLLGSSRQYGRADTEVEPAMVRRMLERAAEYMPAIVELRALRIWAGLRPASHDKLPFIGPHPDHPSILIAAGHEGLGITSSLGSARLIADHLLGRPPAIDPTPFLPGRPSAAEAH